MQKITVSQFKRALAARKKIGAGPVTGQSTGVRHAKGDELEMRRMLDEQRVDAARESSKLQETFRLAAQSRYEAVKYLGASGAKVHLGNIGLLDKPFLIWATPHANILDDSSIERGRSWAKINVEQSTAVHDEDGYPIDSLDRLTFYYLWENETGYTVVVDVSAYTTLWGFWQGAGSYYHKDDGGHVHQPGEPPDEGTDAYGSAHLDLSANLALYEWWNEPPTIAPLQNSPDQHTRIGFLDRGWRGWGDGTSSTMFAGFVLEQNLVVIPPGGVLVTEVSLDVVHRVDHGHVLADFSSGDFQVTSHWVQVEYVAGPELTPTPVVVGLHP
jgi:hypothetical protein